MGVSVTRVALAPGRPSQIGLDIPPVVTLFGETGPVTQRLLGNQIT
jgi:hypothetical protein